MTCSVRISGLSIAAVQPERLSAVEFSVVSEDWAGYNGYRAAPAYNNYGNGNGGLLGGLGGYRGAPAYGNGGYNTGYGQPNGGGSMLTPLIQQFVR